MVEDDPLILDIYATRLERSGFDVHSVTDGAKVVPKLKEEHYDLVLLDLVLPELTGFEVLEKIEKEGLKDVKVLVLSNLSQKREIEKADKLGAAKYLVKAHYTPSEVVEEIKKIST